MAFEISPSYVKTFHHRPNTHNHHHQVLLHAVRRLCVGSGSELQRPRFVAVTTYKCRVRFRRPDDFIIFQTYYRIYKYKILLFGLTNRPATYQQYINNILFDYLDDFYTAYLDNIMIYSKNKLEHQEYVYKVL